MAAFGHMSMKPAICWTDAPWAKQFEQNAKRAIKDRKQADNGDLALQRLYKTSGSQRQWTSGNKTTTSSQAYPVAFCEKVLKLHVWWRCETISQMLNIKELCLTKKPGGARTTSSPTSSVSSEWQRQFYVDMRQRQ